jgi:hypothetical protein
MVCSVIGIVISIEWIRELGLQAGRFSLEARRPDEVEFERHGRPDRAEAMKANSWHSLSPAPRPDRRGTRTTPKGY